MRFKFKNKIGSYPSKDFVVIADDADVGGYYTAPDKWCSFTHGTVHVPPVATDSKRCKIASQKAIPTNNWKKK